MYIIYILHIYTYVYARARAYTLIENNNVNAYYYLT